MLKLEIKMDENKINKEQRYTTDTIYQTLEQTFTRYNLRKESEPDGTVVFYGNGQPKDYGAFGYIITSLKEKSWFMTSPACRWTARTPEPQFQVRSGRGP